MWRRKGDNYILLGFEFSEEDMKQAEMAERSAEAYMERLCAEGRPARLQGEFYTPGTSPEAYRGAWLPLDDAALFSKMTTRMILSLVKKGQIRRREYLRKGKRVYYEYSVDDLMKGM